VSEVTAAQIADDPSRLAALLAGDQPPISDEMAARILKSPFVMAAIMIGVEQALTALVDGVSAGLAARVAGGDVLGGSP
jgi:hypothetical protein